MLTSMVSVSESSLYHACLQGPSKNHFGPRLARDSLRLVWSHIIRNSLKQLGSLGVDGTRLLKKIVQTNLILFSWTILYCLVSCIEWWLANGYYYTRSSLYPMTQELALLYRPYTFWSNFTLFKHSSKNNKIEKCEVTKDLLPRLKWIFCLINPCNLHRKKILIQAVTFFLPI